MDLTLLLILTLFILSVAVIAVLLFILYKEKTEKREILNKYKALEMKVHSVELNTIQYKLNPHLFKNILNSIQSHAYQTYYKAPGYLIYAFCIDY